ncbi:MULTISPECIES: flagellar filament capping protein FliD [Bacillus]|uniref:flagellar filament capping protein FliD n=1 Tax=Bacillus TaxID=1386 RepID=UPI0002F1268B|nr:MULTISPECIES: flagellar filament capping protein FliD [Bacillus]
MVTRISGLASGMDIDSIVSNMMKAQRAPLDKIKQKIQLLEWQRDDYRSMNTLLLNFRTNELVNMKLTSSYRTKVVSSSDESKITATATSSASNASYTISRVEQLATAEVRKNAGSITKNGSTFDASKSLYSQNNSFTTGPINWKEGAVLTENFKTTEKSNTIDLSAIKMNDGESFNVDNIDKDQLSSWSVKVNGKSYQVVTSGTPDANQVLLSNDGKTLTFKDNIDANSDIRLDYIGLKKTENVAVSTNGTVKLSQIGISLPSAGTEEKLKVTIVDKKTSEKKEVNYTLKSTGEILDENDTVIGAVDAETGEIKFNEKAPKNDNASYTLEMKYSHKYTNVSLITNTSDGKQYEKFLVTGSDSLNDLSGKISDSDVGVSMFYDSHTGQMTLTRKETGDFNKSGNDLEVYGDLLNNTLRFGTGASTIQGTNAKFTINGLDTERHSNNFTIDGITFNLKQAFESTDSPVTIGVTNDTNKIYDNIKGFIDKYNELIGQIQLKLDEKRYKDYEPLTDDQKESLSDKQQEKWEGLAKSGLLRRDSILSGVLSNMRSNFYATVKNNEISDKYNQLSKIGITTSANYLDGGKLEINETQLKKAIEENPESVEQLFRGENGIIENLQKTVNNAMDALKEKAGNSNSTNQTFKIGRELDDLEKRQTRFEERLEMLETRYWSQFNAMEQAIQNSNSQSAYLSQFFSS